MGAPTTMEVKMKKYTTLKIPDKIILLLVGVVVLIGILELAVFATYNYEFADYANGMKFAYKSMHNEIRYQNKVIEYQNQEIKNLTLLNSYLILSLEDEKKLNKKYEEAIARIMNNLGYTNAMPMGVWVQK